MSLKNSTERRVAIAIVMVVAALSAWGCEDFSAVGDGDNTDGDIVFDGDTGPCVFDSSCQGGRVCHTGSCIPIDQSPCNEGGTCVQDIQCASLEYCDDSCECTEPPSDGDTDGDDVEGSKDWDCSVKPCINISPRLLDYGNATFGKPTAREVTILNSGGDMLQLISIKFSADTSPDYSWQEGAGPTEDVVELEPEGSIQYVVILTPSDPGVDRGVIEIVCNDLSESNNQGKPTVELISRYKGTTQILVNPTTIDFGEVEVGPESVSRLITVTNQPEEAEANKVLTLDAFTIDPPQTVSYYLDNIQTPVYVAPGESFQFRAYFKPNQEGALDATLKIQHDADRSGYDPPNPVEVPLLGSGVVPCLEVYPPSVEFGEVTINQTRVITVTLRNCGGGLVEMGGIEWRQPAPDDFEIYDPGDAANARIPKLEEVTFSIKFTPTTVGADYGILNVTSNNFEQETIQVPVHGQGVSSVIEVNPTVLNFGKVLLGTTDEQVVTVTNRGQGDLEINGISFDALGSNAFDLDQASWDLLPVTLGYGEPAAFTVTYSPTHQEVNYFDEGTMIIATNHPSAPEFTVTLEGQPVWPLCEFSLLEDMNFDGEDGSIIDFGEVVVDRVKKLNLRIHNGGTWPCQITKIGFNVGSSPDFGFFPPVIPDIQENGNYNVQLTYSPVEWAGPDNGELRLETNDSQYDVMEGGLPVNKIEFPVIANACKPQIRIEPNSSASNPIHSGLDNILKTECSEPVDVTITNIGDCILELYGWDFYQLGFEGSWVVSAWSIPPLGPYKLRPVADYPDDHVDFTVTFCPQGLPITQRMTMRISSNDYATQSTFSFWQGTGVECPTNCFDLDPEEPGCEYCCVLPTGQTRPGEEKCDGFDNDCDGKTDEPFVCNRQTDPDCNDRLYLGENCVGVGQCGAGVGECRLDKAGVICDSMQTHYQGTTELCDGLDNDCNGKVDETFYIGELCEGIGECGLGHWKCDPDDVYTRYCDALDDATDELCDFKDNDCDGTTDNGNFYEYIPGEDPGEAEICADCVGRPCEGSGECARGYYMCGFLILPSTPGVPAQVLSDVYHWIACSADIGGAAEVCNDADDNCNGQTDEGFNLGDACNGVGECGAGVKECNPYNVTSTICSSDLGGSQYNDPVVGGKPETCDGKDNDCDAKIDEEFSLGAYCVGKGECGPGELECNLVTKQVRCSTDVGGSDDNSQPEICDGKDNNCNDAIDEIFTVGLPCVGEGTCGVGVWVCNGPADVCCSVNPGCSNSQAQTEKCDGRDNDCDGLTDEDFLVGQTCPGEGECADGRWECKNLYERRCSTNPGGSQYAGSAEICDGKDNDCDASSDEGYGIGNQCDGIGECPIGEIECAPDVSEVATRCSTDSGGSDFPNPPPFEICDGKDNDCDGVADDGFDTGGDDINNCGGCNKVCTVANGTPACDNGDCEIASCNTNFHDVDGLYDTGCECEVDTDDRASRGNACGATSIQTNPANLLDSNRAITTVSGNISPADDKDWFTFTAKDSTDTTCDKFHVDVHFTSNPDYQYRFDVYKGGCGTALCTGRTWFEYVTDHAYAAQGADDNYWGVGECPCKPASDDYPEGTVAACTDCLTFPYNYCLSDEATFFVKVYRVTQGGQVANCDPYVLEISNGFYDTVIQD